MDEPILKVHWERFRAHVDLDVLAASRLLPYYKSLPFSNVSNFPKSINGCQCIKFKSSYIVFPQSTNKEYKGGIKSLLLIFSIRRSDIFQSVIFNVRNINNERFIHEVIEIWK